MTPLEQLKHLYAIPRFIQYFDLSTVLTHSLISVHFRWMGWLQLPLLNGNLRLKHGPLQQRPHPSSGEGGPLPDAAQRHQVPLCGRTPVRHRDLPLRHADGSLVDRCLHSRGQAGRLLRKLHYINRQQCSGCISR